MLDELRPEGLGDDVRGAGEGGVDVAALDRETESTLPPRAARARRRRLERVRHRLEHLVLDLDERGRLAGGAAGLGRDGGDHVADVGGRLALGDELAPVRA